MMITIVCYNQIETWHRRENAIDFFYDCMLNTEGAEQKRYINILIDLNDGRNKCHDGSSISYDIAKEEGRFYKTIAPDGSRDYNNKIWYSES